MRLASYPNYILKLRSSVNGRGLENGIKKRKTIPKIRGKTLYFRQEFPRQKQRRHNQPSHTINGDSALKRVVS